MSQIENTPQTVETTPSLLDARPIQVNTTSPLDSHPVLNEVTPESLSVPALSSEGLTVEKESELLADTEFPEDESPLPDQTPVDLGRDEEGSE